MKLVKKSLAPNCPQIDGLSYIEKAALYNLWSRFRIFKFKQLRESVSLSEYGQYYQLLSGDYIARARC